MKLFGFSLNKRMKGIAKPSVRETQDYYDRESERYLESYGDHIQAARPADDDAFLSYLAASIGISDGQRLLDAGCGTCGPAIAFAGLFDVLIEALTISGNQAKSGRNRIAEAGLSESINVRQGDFHEIGSIYSGEHFDRVFFLEALGYAHDIDGIVCSVNKVLKPGGRIYIKEFFPVPLSDSSQRGLQLDIMLSIRKEYKYRLLELNPLVGILRDHGFFIEFVRTLGFEEDFSRAAEFEKRNAYSSYTRAITNPYQLFEPLELRFQKPHR